MANKSNKSKAPKARVDRRYKDPDEAPEIVSEKRVTFFISHHSFLRMKKLGARNTIANTDDDGERPENPSAVARVAIEKYLDEIEAENGD